MKSPKCMVCGGKAWQGASLLEGFWECSSCGLIWMWPQPRQEFRYKIDDLRRHIDSSSSLNRWAQRLGILGWYQQGILNQRKKVVTDLLPGGRLLDVGCEWGGFMKQFDGKWEVFGVDINSNARGPKVWIGDVAKYKSRQKFDVVTLWQTFEHLQNLQFTMNNLQGLIKRGGYLVIEVPSGEARWRKVFGRDWRLWMYPQHVWFWTSKSLGLFVQHNGFEVVKVEQVGIMSSGPGSVVAKTGQLWLGVVLMPVMSLVSWLDPQGRDNLRVVARITKNGKIG